MNEGRPIFAGMALTTWRMTGRLGADDLIVWRRSEGLSQGAAGRWLRLSQRYVARIEARERLPADLHERLLWALWRYYGLVGPEDGPPKATGPKKRRPRGKRPTPFDKYEQLARESQAVSPFKR